MGEAKGTVGDEHSVHRGSYLSVYDRSKHEGEQAAFAAAHRTGVEVVAINPSSVQGPGRAAGNGKLIIDYLNGKLPVFVDTYVSVVDIADCAEAPHAGRRARARRRTLRPQRRDDHRRPRRSSSSPELSGVRHRVRIVPPRGRARRPAARARGGVRAARPRAVAVPRAHPHVPARPPYDGSLAERELGLAYTPVEETFRRTIAWAVDEGLIER